MPRSNRSLDGVAIGMSVMCLVHCLMLPVLFIMMPALSAYLAIPDNFHWIVLVIAAPTSGVALYIGYKIHERIIPVLLISIGLTLMAIGALSASVVVDTTSTVAGVGLLAFGHAINWRSRSISIAASDAVKLRAIAR